MRSTDLVQRVTPDQEDMSSNPLCNTRSLARHWKTHLLVDTADDTSLFQCAVSKRYWREQYREIKLPRLRLAIG